LSSRGNSNSGTPAAPERASRARQRQRLIDACISALHIHGPSRTTVEKVVAIAEMSPGIVRFYFDSKDAMLVASLAYLATEFEERVMTPVARLKETPVRALEQLVELYLDPDIASPRKVSVWYSFWGEASSRQEYYELCGKKDDDFAALVRELIERVVVHSGDSHLDPDAVALGLIGVLEVLWQRIAFTDEAQIDRAAAKQRSLSYLRSVFPSQFGGAMPPALSATLVPAWAFADPMLLSLERERLFRPSWQFVGHEGDLPRPGDFVTLELAGERVLAVRGSDGGIRVLRNSCRKRPHALVARARGHLGAQIRCDIHHLHYGLDGKLRSGSTPGDLIALELATPGGFILVRPFGAASAPPPPAWNSLPGLQPASATETEIAADWKLLVEQWLEAPPPGKGRQRLFLTPNHLLETHSAGATLLQVIPINAGRCRLRRLEFARAPGGGRRRSPKGGRSRSSMDWVRADIEVAESMQAGILAGAFDAEEPTTASPALADFRRSVASLLPGLEASRRSS
jgi:TetR/AcrR family transcriptional repressor of bet genes